MKLFLNINFLGIILILNFTGCSSNKIPDFSNCTVLSTKEIIENFDYTLVIVTGAGCGYCEFSLDYFLNYSNKDKINIIIYEYGDVETINTLHSTYFDDFVFLEANSCSYYDDDELPLYFLYYKDKLITKQSGFNKNSLDKIESKIILNK